MGIFDNVHAGSWFNLPDFGITERLTGNRSSQGGSQIFGNNQATSGDTLGATTSAPQSNALFGPSPMIGPQQVKQPSSGGVSGQAQQPQQQNMSLPSNDQSGQINQGWDSYTNSLNDLLNNNLPGQKTSQEQIAQNAYNTGVTQAGEQKTQGVNEVNTQQASSLKDLASNVRNLFNAGNTYLGAKGASDSSAANQYSYAITQMGTKERGNIMKQAQDRVSQIGDIYNSEVNRLQSDLTSNMASISQWFSEQQSTLKQQLGQAGLGRSQDLQAASQNLYNQALTAMQQVQTDVSNRRQSLESWALNNSKTVQEAIQNMNTVADSMPQFGGIQGGMPQVTPEGQQYIPTGYGATTNEQKDIFGNRII